MLRSHSRSRSQKRTTNSDTNIKRGQRCRVYLLPPEVCARKGQERTSSVRPGATVSWSSCRCQCVLESTISTRAAASTGSISCAPTTEWGVQAGVGGSTSSGVSSTPASSTPTSCGSRLTGLCWRTLASSASRPTSWSWFMNCAMDTNCGVGDSRQQSTTWPSHRWSPTMSSRVTRWWSGSDGGGSARCVHVHTRRRHRGAM